MLGFPFQTSCTVHERVQVLPFLNLCLAAATPPFLRACVWVASPSWWFPESPSCRPPPGRPLPFSSETNIEHTGKTYVHNQKCCHSFKYFYTLKIKNKNKFKTVLSFELNPGHTVKPSA